MQTRVSKSMLNFQGLATLAFAYYALALVVLPAASAMAPAPPKSAKMSNDVADEADDDEYERSEDADEAYVTSELVGTAQILSPKSSESKLAAWATWLVDSCGVPEDSLANLALASFKQPNDMVVRGLAATRSVSEGERLVCIPEKCWIHEPEERKTSEESEGCASIDEMAVNLAEEIAKGADSKYTSWLSLLPDETSFRNHHPAFAKDNAHGPTFNYWKSVSDNVTRCAKHRSAEPDSKEVSPESLLLASVLVRTRTSNNWGLVPVLDMVNAGKHENVEMIMKDMKGLHLCLKTIRPVAKDEELHASYRASLLHAGHFFTKHGFALDPDSHSFDSMEWCKEGSHKLPEEDSHPALAWFMSIWEKHCVVKPEEPAARAVQEETEEETHLEPFEDVMTPEIQNALAELRKHKELAEMEASGIKKPVDPLDDWDTHHAEDEL